MAFQHVSASSIKLFESCEKRWFYRYILGHKDKGTPAMELGSAVHEKLENYLEKGELPDVTSIEGEIASTGLKYLPKPGEGELGIETSLDEIPIADLPKKFKGFIDCWIKDDEVPEILDHKTSSNMKYAKTPAQLAEDTQMIIYARHVLEHCDAQSITLSHVVYLTKPPYQSEKNSITVTREHVYDRFDKILETVHSMIEASQISGNHQKQNKGFCYSYGKRCPHYDACHITPKSIGVKMNDKQNEIIARLRGNKKPTPKSESAELPQESDTPNNESTPISSSTLYIDCAFIKGEAAQTAEEALAPLIKEVCEEKGVEHISFVPYAGGWDLLTAKIEAHSFSGNVVISSNSALYNRVGSALTTKFDLIVKGCN